MADHYYAVIMAGGGGTRLWPVSRQANPKQMLKLFGERSLFQISVERLSGLFKLDNIFVVTTASQAKELQVQVPAIPKANYLIEPMPRGTAAVVAMAAAALQKLDPEATLAVLTADHFIENVTGFHQALLAAQKLATQGNLVTLGIKPTMASTGYGYIESGEKLGKFDSLTGYSVKRYVEKPNSELARQFLESPLMNWNSGMFITRADVILNEYQQHMPDLFAQIETLKPFLAADHSCDAFVGTWSGIIPQTIDYGIMEKSACVAVIPVSDLGWNDVGSWDSFFDVMDPDENGNIILGSAHIGLETSGSLVISTDPRFMVVTMGMSNMIVVKTSDALLICPRGQSQRVKELVQYLKEHQYTLFL